MRKYEKMCQHFPKLCKHFSKNVKVGLDFSNHLTESDVKKAAFVD